MANKTKTLVIGAGVSGCFNALELADKGYQVILVDLGDEILPLNSSSINQTYRIHVGPHYLKDLETAKHCLLNSIQLTRELSEFIAGGENLTNPLRRGKYFVVEPSLITAEEAEKGFFYLKNVYKELVEKDSKNKVFGEPEDFYKIITKADYPYVADAIDFTNAEGKSVTLRVSLGVETCEPQVDIYKLKAHLQRKIKEHSHIQFINRSKVTHIAYLTNALGYKVTIKKEDGTSQHLDVDAVVNCSWQNIERLDKQIGFHIPDEKKVNRVKASIVVDTPDSMKGMSSFMFITGPFSSISFLTNGKAVITSEKLSNIDFWTAGQDILPFHTQDALKDLSLETEKGRSLAKEILTDAASYLSEDVKNELNKAEIEELRVGYVKYKGKNLYTKNSIYTADSDIHTRRDTGIEEQDLNYFSCPAMKWIFAPPNAKVIGNKMDEHFPIQNDLAELISKVRQQLLPNFVKSKVPITILDSLLHITYRSYLLTQVAPQFFDNHKDPEKVGRLDGAEKKSQVQTQLSNYRKDPTKCVNEVTAKLKCTLLFHNLEERISSQRLKLINLSYSETTVTQRKIHEEIAAERSARSDRVSNVLNLSQEGLNKFSKLEGYVTPKQNSRRSSNEWDTFLGAREKNVILDFAKDLKEVKADPHKLSFISSRKLDKEDKKAIENFFRKICADGSSDLKVAWKNTTNTYELELNTSEHDHKNILLEQVLDSLSQPYVNIRKMEVAESIKRLTSYLIEVSKARCSFFNLFNPNKKTQLAAGMTTLLHYFCDLPTDKVSSHPSIQRASKKLPKNSQILDTSLPPVQITQVAKHGS